MALEADENGPIEFKLHHNEARGKTISSFGYIFNDCTRPPLIDCNEFIFTSLVQMNEMMSSLLGLQTLQKHATTSAHACEVPQDVNIREGA